MNSRTSPAAPAVGILAAAILALSGCTSLSAHLPWRHKAPPPPEVSTALTVALPDGAAVSWPQFWLRNDVVVDMTAVTGTGSAVVAPRTGLAWPVRVAFRVAPGAIGAIDVRGAERVVIPVPSTGSTTVDVELPPGIYRAATKQITVNWGPAIEAIAQ